VAFAICVAVAAAAQAARQRTLMPVDESTNDASWLAFRTALNGALRARDAAFVETILVPNILVSFGPESGIAAFHDRWKLQNPRDPFWEKMLGTLALGGQFLDRRFCAPYVYTAFPDDLDAIDYYVVTKAHAPLRSRADAAAPVSRVLSYDIVRRPHNVERATAGWAAVILDDGVRGYLSTADIRSPIDYRACFSKVDGRWKLTMFVAGD
jgi:hypothetical protein